jgi:hypothetical protein
MIAAKTVVTALAKITGTLLVYIPKMSHKAVPTVNTTYIAAEIEDVFLVRII